MLSRLQKRKSTGGLELIDEAQNKRKREDEGEVVAEKKAEPAKKRATKRTKRTKSESNVLDSSSYDAVEEAASTDLTLIFPNEVLVHILSFLTYKEIIQSAFMDRRWYAIGSSAELWSMFCRKMNWQLPLNNKKLTHKTLFLRRIASKSYCCCCGTKTSCRFPLLNLTLCKSCRATEPEFATLNKTQSKADYFLDDYDLEKVRYVVSSAGWGRKKYVYLKSDIEAAAIAKFGGQEGLDDERAKRKKARTSRADKLVLKMENRARDLEEELRLTGWPKKYAVGPRSFPILLPTELLNGNYEQYLRAPDRGKPAQSFAYVFSLNCQRYLDTGFGALFVANMSLVDQIEAYFEKERKRNNLAITDSDVTTTTTTTSSEENNNNPNNNNNNNTTISEGKENNNNNNNNSISAPTTTTTTTTTTTSNSEGQENNNNNNNKNDSKNNNSKITPPATNPANGRPLTTYAGATYDAELRRFYMDILYARIEQIWQHPYQYDLPEESVEEDDHMGVLFDKHAHFCKKLKTPNDILKRIYDDAATAMFGPDSDDDGADFDPDDSDDDDSDSDGPIFCPHIIASLLPLLVGGYNDDDDSSDGDDDIGPPFFF